MPSCLSFLHPIPTPIKNLEKGVKLLLCTGCLKDNTHLWEGGFYYNLPFGYLMSFIQRGNAAAHPGLGVQEVSGAFRGRQQDWGSPKRPKRPKPITWILATALSEWKSCQLIL